MKDTLDKHSIYLDLRPLNADALKEIVEVLEGAGEDMMEKTKADLLSGQVSSFYRHYNLKLENGKWYRGRCFNKETEVTFSQFKEMFPRKNEAAQEQSIFDAINALTELCYSRSKAAGWHDTPREDGTMIALIHSEVSEAMEGLRKDLMDDHLPHRKMAEVELADSIIRICDFAGLKGYDLGGAIKEKLKYNSQRSDHKRENRAKDGGKKF